MSTLRSQIIRLAASAPPSSPLRRELLGLLAPQGKVAREDWKTLVSNDKVRIQMQDHPDNSLVIQEVPGKPFKQKLRRRRYDTRYLVQWFHPGGAFLMSNIVQRAKLSSSMSFDQAMDAMDKAMEDSKDALIAESKVLAEKYKDSHPGIYVEYTEDNFKRLGFPKSYSGNVDEVPFLEVEPSDYEPISFRGKDFGGKSEWTKFTFYDDADEDEWMAQMEGMRAFYKSTSAGGSRKLFKLLKANPDALKGMAHKDFTELLQRNKIGYDYIPTVWR